MNILVACEESQVVAAAFRNKGHNAFSCDIIPCSGNHPEYHIVNDVIPLLNGNCSFTTQNGNRFTILGRWDMIIAFPPCTYMSKAGARWMYPKKGIICPYRYEAAMDAKAFFMQIYNADCDKIVIENPRPLKIVGLPEPSQIIQPYEHGHPYTKETMLWIKGVSLLQPSCIVKPVSPYVPSGTSRKIKSSYGAAKRGDDAKNRSKTFTGVGAAMADQWG